MPWPPPVTITTLSLSPSIIQLKSWSDGVLEDWDLRTITPIFQYSIIPVLSSDSRIDQRLGRKHLRDFAAHGANTLFYVLQWKDMANHFLDGKFGLFDEPERGFGGVVISGKTTLKLDLTPDELVHEHRRYRRIPSQTRQHHGGMPVQTINGF